MDKNTLNSVKSQITKVKKSNAKIYLYVSKVPLKFLGVSCLNVTVDGEPHSIFFSNNRWSVQAINLSLVCCGSWNVRALCMEDQKSNRGNVDSILHEFNDRFEGLGILKNF